MPLYTPRLPLVGDGRTVTVSTPLLDLTQTWNNAAVTFTGWKLNVTDTASASGSLLLQLQKGGANVFSVRKDGYIVGANSITLSAGDVDMRSDSGRLSWGAAQDLLLVRDAANTLAQRNGTNAQALRVYGTYTDASNYERAAIKHSAGIVELAAETAGTGTDNIDVALTPAGAGAVRFGTHSAIAAETVTGYITVKDAAGNSRKLAVVS